VRHGAGRLRRRGGQVEHPGRGDDTRDWGMRIGKTETTYYNSMNRNKRSITLDLQTPEGVKIVHELLPQFDVVIHNFKTGGAEKLGLGYEQLKAIKPDLIYCAVAGYDSSGPEAKRPGYDLVIQGEAGLMALNGEAGMPPLKFGVAVVDLVTGMYAAQAVLAALFRRDARARAGSSRWRCTTAASRSPATTAWMPCNWATIPSATAMPTPPSCPTACTRPPTAR
jgi:crotonobetainyl-CoA:carnitine CoA-transferase CaiB-like acyl-CoA transferase